MYYIVGLGNPGADYLFTRHNAGFLFLDYLNKKFCNKKESRSYSYDFISCNINSNELLLVKPQTYMNLSGKAIWELKKNYGDIKENLIVIYDDIALPLGKIRIRKKGSAGGHNGVKSIINALNGDEEFVRIRIGISSSDENDLKDYVLSDFSDKELEVLYKVFDMTIDALNTVLSDGIEKAMGIFNGKSVL